MSKILCSKLVNERGRGAKNPQNPVNVVMDAHLCIHYVIWKLRRQTINQNCTKCLMQAYEFILYFNAN